MNLLGTFWKRTGALGSNIAFTWSHKKTPPTDSLEVISLTGPIMFTYTPAGQAPVDAYNEPMLQTNVLFSYTIAGQAPIDSYEDALSLSPSITFTYTL